MLLSQQLEHVFGKRQWSSKSPSQNKSLSVYFVPISLLLIFYKYKLHARVVYTKYTACRQKRGRSMCFIFGLLLCFYSARSAQGFLTVRDLSKDY